MLCLGTLLVPLLPLLLRDTDRSTTVSVAATRPDPAPPHGGFRDEILAEDAQWEQAIERVKAERVVLEAEAARREAERAAQKRAADARAAAAAKAKREAEAKARAAKAARAASTEKPVLAPSSTGNTQTGKASWFSAPAGTCAHRTVAVGTIIGVTNTDNGRTATCKVTGRGPFIDGRIIDLDKATFSQLASTTQGVINVRIEW